MADNYYDATGVLILDRVTPIITALFRDFNLDASYPGNGAAYIAQMSDNPHWIDILDKLTDLAIQLNLSLPDISDLSLETLLPILATHFGTDQNEELENLIEHHLFEDPADIDALFLIATCCNDGHNLAAIQLEGCWHCSKPRLFEFGGNGSFISQEITLFSSSTHALQLGEKLRNAILTEATEDAANLIAQETIKLLVCINDETLRAKLQQCVIEKMLVDSSSNSNI